MCNLYTKGFVKTGMLEKEGRATYQQMPSDICTVVDRQRAVNEIALINTETGEVTYGIYSLLKIVGNSFPVFKPLFTCRPFIWMMSKVYAFISYNRRVIMPAREDNMAVLQPSFNKKYRLMYLLVTWLLTATILNAYAPLLSGLIPAGRVFREYVICGGQILFQGVILSGHRTKQRWDYWGNMMTISLAGALLLGIGIMLSRLISLPATAYAIYFMGIAGLMLLEHTRRTRLLHLGWIPTLSWVTYRVIVLLLILTIH